MNPEGGFLGLMTVGDKHRHQVHHEIRQASVSSVLDLGDVLELFSIPVSLEQFPKVIDMAEK